MSRVRPVSVRPTPEEYADWLAEAKRSKITVSAWLRRCAKEVIDLRRAVERADEEAARRARRLHGLDPFDARRRLASEDGDDWLDRFPDEHDEEAQP